MHIQARIHFESREKNAHQMNAQMKTNGAAYCSITAPCSNDDEPATSGKSTAHRYGGTIRASTRAGGEI